MLSPGKVIISGPTKDNTGTVTVTNIKRVDTDIVLDGNCPAKLSPSERASEIGKMLRKEGIFFVARVDRAYAGSLVANIYSDGSAYIGKVYTVQSQRNKGVAGYLMDAVIGTAQELKLKSIRLWTTNPIAKHIYQKKGFVEQCAEGSTTSHFTLQFSPSISVENPIDAVVAEMAAKQL